MQLKQLVVLFMLFVVSFQLCAQTDKVYTANGDVLIGELVSMQGGILVFDTDYADSKFNIDWDEITGMEIDKDHLIYTDDGNKYRGSLVPLLSEGRLTRLVTEDGELTMTLDKIVEIVSLEKNFWDRMAISIDAGLSITKANNVQQRSIAGDLHYRGDKWLVRAYYSGVATTQDDVEPIDRADGGLSFKRDVYGNSMAFGGLEFLSSTEQQLDLRSTGTLGAGYFFIRNNRVYFFGGAGFAVSNEKYNGEEPSQENNLEGLIQTEFNAYRMGDFSLMAKVVAYPGISQSDRWRINTDLVFKYNLPLDFYIKLSLVHNYDSQPPADVTQTDYSLQTSIGWEWN